MNLTKEQIKECLERLQSYSAWLFYSEDAATSLLNDKREIEGYRFGLKIDSNGHIVVVLDSGEEATFITNISTRPVTQGLDNLSFSYDIVNKDELTIEKLKIFHKISPFVLSYFQRSVSFIWLARMHPDTIEQYSSALVTANKEK